MPRAYSAHQRADQSGAVGFCHPDANRERPAIGRNPGPAGPSDQPAVEQLAEQTEPPAPGCGTDSRPIDTAAANPGIATTHLAYSSACSARPTAFERGTNARCCRTRPGRWSAPAADAGRKQ